MEMNVCPFGREIIHVFNARRNLPLSCVCSIAGQLHGEGFLSPRDHEHALYLTPDRISPSFDQLRNGARQLPRVELPLQVIRHCLEGTATVAELGQSDRLFFNDFVAASSKQIAARLFFAM
jgi:hypothetical protein